MNLKRLLLETALVLTPFFFVKSQEYSTLYEKNLAQKKYWENKNGFTQKSHKFPFSLLNKLSKEWSSYEYYIHNGKEILLIQEKDSIGKSDIKVIEENHYGTIEKISLIRTEPENSFIFTAEKIDGKLILYKSPKEEYSNPINLMNTYLDCDRKFWMFTDNYQIYQKIKKHNPKNKEIKLKKRFIKKILN